MEKIGCDSLSVFTVKEKLTLFILLKKDRYAL